MEAVAPRLSCSSTLPHCSIVVFPDSKQTSYLIPPTAFAEGRLRRTRSPRSADLVGNLGCVDAGGWRGACLSVCEAKVWGTARLPKLRSGQGRRRRLWLWILFAVVFCCSMLGAAQKAICN